MSTTSDLRQARREHAERGGYLLRDGDLLDRYTVCSESEAILSMGRSHQQLAALAPHYDETRTR